MLERLVRDLDLKHAVTLAGFLPEEQLADYYRAADLFVLPTASLEGFGLVTVDALACGTPVLGTPVGATAEILEPLDARLLTAGTESQDLADGILAFWKGTWRFALSPERLHGYVRDRFTWDRHVAATLAVYEEALHAN
jgi:glycosyltransferase involved in cell wall biosynthesis